MGSGNEYTGTGTTNQTGVSASLLGQFVSAPFRTPRDRNATTAYVPSTGASRRDRNTHRVSNSRRPRGRKCSRLGIASIRRRAVIFERQRHRVFLIVRQAAARNRKKVDEWTQCGADIARGVIARNLGMGRDRMCIANAVDWSPERQRCPKLYRRIFRNCQLIWISILR